MKDLMFRRALEADLEPLLDLLRDLHAEDAPVTREQLKSVWKNILQNDGIRHYLAESEGILVAACHLVIVPNLTRRAAPYGLIENVVTRKEYRRLGIGTQLLQHALGEAWALGCYKVMLMTGREEAHPFYEKAGFKQGLKTAFVAKPEK
jgi:GNAT superfamily N-acetyltransferase